MIEEAMGQEERYVEGKLIPVMREAVLSVQMILFKVLKASVQARYVDQIEPFPAHLAGAVINNLFSSQPLDQAIVVFAASNREMVERELRELAGSCSHLVPILTDALRMQTICDNQEGIHSIPSLLMAKALGILQEERPLPLPSTFMIQVRHLATEHGLVAPMEAAPPPEESPA